MNVRCPECLTMYRIDPAKVTRRLRARCTHCPGLLTIEAPGLDGATSAPPHDADAVTHGRTTPPPASLESMETDVGAQAAHEADHEVEPDKAVTHVPTRSIDHVGATRASSTTIDHVGATHVSPPELEPAPPTVQVSRPFVQPRIAPSAMEPARPKRPSAPVFRPTPGMPLQTAPVPPPSRPTAGGLGPGEHGSDGDRGPPSSPASTLVTAPASQSPINPYLSRDPRDRARRLARALVSDIIVYEPEKRRLALEDGTLPEVFREEIGKSWREYRQQMGEEFANSTPYFTEALNEILAEGRQIF